MRIAALSKSEVEDRIEIISKCILISKKKV